MQSIKIHYFSPIIFILFLILFSSCSQLISNEGLKHYKPQESFQDDTKNLNPYQVDMTYLNDLCENAFPDIESAFPDGKRKLIVDSLLQLMSQTDCDRNKFNGYACFYLSHLHNSHTTISGIESKTIFPFWFHFYNDKWFLWDVGNKYDSTLIGKEILKINGIPILEFENKLSFYLSFENEVSKHKEARFIFSQADKLKQYGLIENADSILLTFGMDRNLWIKSTTNVSEIKYHLGNNRFSQNPITKRVGYFYNTDYYQKEDFAYFQFNRCFDLIDANETMKDYLKPWIVPFAKLYLNYQVSRKNSEKTHGFVDVNRPIFKDFLKNMFDSLETSGIHNLIIDLRNNPGGSTLLGIQLMYHLSDDENLKDFSEYFVLSEYNKQIFPEKYNIILESYLKNHKDFPPNGIIIPYKYMNCDSALFEKISNPNSPFYISKSRPVFHGKVFVLVNYYTNSAAALLATLLQDNGLAIVIGTTVSNNPIGASGFHPFKLLNTGFEGSVATNYYVRPSPEKGIYLIPDYIVENTVEDYLQSQDQLLNKAFELIEKNKMTKETYKTIK